MTARGQYGQREITPVGEHSRDSRRLRPFRAEPMQPDSEDQDQDRPGKEGRHSVPDVGQGRGPAGRLALSRLTACREPGRLWPRQRRSPWRPGSARSSAAGLAASSDPTLAFSIVGNNPGSRGLPGRASAGIGADGRAAQAGRPRAQGRQAGLRVRSPRVAPCCGPPGSSHASPYTRTLTRTSTTAGLQQAPDQKSRHKAGGAAGGSHWALVEAHRRVVPLFLG